MIATDSQLRAIQDFLESVTGECYRRKIVENDDQTLLLAWQSDTRVDYLLHIMVRQNAHRVAFAIQRYRDIETRYDRTLNPTQFKRLIDDPRLGVMYMVGQIYDE